MLTARGAAALGLGTLALLPATASATALSGVSTSLGLAGSLLALLASQRGSPAHAATLLGLAALALLAGVGALRLRATGAVGRPLLGRGAAMRSGDRALLSGAREHFLHLQSAWDAADLEALRRLTTEDMFEELAAELPGRGQGPNRTEVLALEAHLIAVERLGPLELASIEFSGVVRETGRRGPAPFREVWMLARRQPGDAWRLARQQALF